MPSTLKAGPVFAKAEVESKISVFPNFPAGEATPNDIATLHLFDWAYRLEKPE